MALGEQNPVYGPFFGVMGAAAAIIFSGIYQYWKKRKWMSEFCKELFGTYYHCSLLNDTSGISNDVITNELYLLQRSELPMEQQNQAQVSLRCQSWDLNWLWNQSFLSLWRVLLPSTDWSSPFWSLVHSKNPPHTLFTSELAKNSFFHFIQYWVTWSFWGEKKSMTMCPHTYSKAYIKYKANVERKVNNSRKIMMEKMLKVHKKVWHENLWNF